MARIYTPTVQLTTSPVGQLRLIQNAFNDLKAGTVKEITEHVKQNGLVTVQDPFRVVMYYMITLRKAGKVREITEQERTDLRTSAEPKTTKSTKPTKTSSQKQVRK